MNLLKLICSPVLNIFNSVLYTFHYVSIKTWNNAQLGQDENNLHSTMYLLKRNLALLAGTHLPYLHSTMYLLKHDRGWRLLCRPLFTFHHVSIKTSKLKVQWWSDRYLHSTMYLLKHRIWCQLGVNYQFTFHHVSIKTIRYLI